MSRSSSRSASASPQKRLPRSGGFDSFVKGPEAKPAPMPRPKKKKPGLEVEIGAKVDVHGLVGAAQYNGCEGKVLAGPNEKGRFKVNVIFQGETKELALLPANLQPKPTCGWEIVIAGLGNLFDEHLISGVFAQFGRVMSCKVTRDLNGESKGVALVVMALKENAERALSMSEELKIKGRSVILAWSTMVKTEMGLMKNRDEANNTEDDPNAPDAGGGRPLERRKFHEGQEVKDLPSAQGVTDTVAQGPFAVGQRLLISGLKGAPQYNGTTCQVQGYRGDGRCEVLLGGGSEEKKTLALKIENLSKVEAASAGDDDGKEDEEQRPRRSFREASATAQQPLPARGVPDSRRGGSHASEDRSDEDAERRREGLSSTPSTAQDGGVTEPQQAPPQPIPPKAVLSMLSAKELKGILIAHGVDLSSCFEKADFLEKACSLASAPSEEKR